MTRTPFRVTLGGGGTDLPSYYSKYGGFVVSTAISRHMYVVVNRMFESKIRVSYSKTEIVDNDDEIRHPVVREALKYLGMSKHLEIVSIADVPSSTGLGSSGSFAVGLLHALHLYREDPIFPMQLADEACTIQMDILRENEGKQDPHIAAYGGTVALDIHRDGHVKVIRLNVHEDCLQELQNSLLFFYTGIRRASGSVLSEQQSSIRREKADVLDAMHQIKQIGFKVKRAVEEGNVLEFGRLQNEHWMVKRKLTSNMTSNAIDKWYDAAIRAGALGGKVIGAGGGGFMMFCADRGRNEVRKAMAREGLAEMNFGIGAGGTKAVVNF